MLGETGFDNIDVLLAAKKIKQRRRHCINGYSWPGARREAIFAVFMCRYFASFPIFRYTLTKL